jgi:hypothetical protein
MDTCKELLDSWCNSASVMHIAHHKAAASCARTQRWLGVLVASLGAVVASSLFIAVSEGRNPTLLLITGIVSMVTAVLSAVNSSLDLGGRSQRHYSAAVAFQGLRREIEEQLVSCKSGTPEDRYLRLRERWTAALEGSIPLPPRIHDAVKSKLEPEPLETS